jgi:hypothetical protein
MLLAVRAGFLLLATAFCAANTKERTKWDSHLTPLWDGGHIKLWSYKTLSQLFREVGFRVVRFVGAGKVPFL